MSRWMRAVVVILWALSLVGAAAWGARAQEQGQQEKEKLPPGVTVLSESDARVLSGPDVGFRVHRMERGRALGTFVVKMGDQWIEVGAMPRVVPLR